MIKSAVYASMTSVKPAPFCNRSLHFILGISIGQRSGHSLPCIRMNHHHDGLRPQNIFREQLLLLVFCLQLENGQKQHEEKSN